MNCWLVERLLLLSLGACNYLKVQTKVNAGASQLLLAISPQLYSLQTRLEATRTYAQAKRKERNTSSLGRVVSMGVVVSS
jgi:hypothetical protein